MNKDFDAVKMMREIRHRLSERYQDSGTEEQELLQVRKKYGLVK